MKRNDCRVSIFTIGAAIMLATTGTNASAQQVFNGEVGVEITAKVSVREGCTINGGNGQGLIDFGIIYDAKTLSTDVDSSTGLEFGGTPIILTCNFDLTNASLSIGPGESDLAGVRRLRKVDEVSARFGNPFSAYHLYADAGRTASSEYTPDTSQPIGNGFIPAGTPTEITVYGRIFNQDVPEIVGDYVDVMRAVLVL